jgi:dihydrolipoamide dehydrogenase
MADTYDLVVIGGGPGGYVAAIRAAQLGMKTACVEQRDALGGTCLNVGCIPSKELLHSSHLFEQASEGLERHGITISGKVSLDLKKMMAGKDEVVSGLTKGIAGLFKKYKVEWVKGAGRIAAKGKVVVDGGEERTLETKNILIATGSEPMPLPGVEVDEKRILSSTGALALAKVPKHLVVIGGGYIGLEMGMVWRRLGAEVTVVEFLDSILPAMDADIVRTMHRLLEKKGWAFRLGTKVTGAKSTRSGVELTVEPAKGGEAETLKADAVLVAIGRRPVTEGLGLEEVGVALDERGRIKTDGGFRTSVDGIWAIGDVIDGPMLAHKAMDEGVVAVERMAGQGGALNYDCIPGVVYTWPEVASVGRTEKELKDAGVEYRSGKFFFMANSRARTTGETDGFVKVLADAKTDRVLGVHIIGPQAGDLIAEAVAVMEFGGSAEDIARTCHAHPTLAEAVKEAAHGVSGHMIHS